MDNESPVLVFWDFWFNILDGQMGIFFFLKGMGVGVLGGGVFHPAFSR